MLKINSVDKKLGDFHLKNINLDIFEGEYFVILGPTGTGKTVVLELIAGLHFPDNGDILFGDKNLLKLYPEQREVGFVYQDYALFPHLTVKENILFGMKIRKYPEKTINEKLTEMVEMLGIGHLLERYTSTLSGGEQQRTALARALVTSPKILLMDEPLSALDPRSKDIFQNELKSIHKSLNTTTIHVTHDFNEALFLADRIGVMHEGSIIQVGTPQEIFRKPQNTFVASFVGIENIYEGERNGNVISLAPEVSFYTEKNGNGKINVTVHPEDIVISKQSMDKRTKNSFCGRVSGIVNKGPLCKLTLDIGVPLTCFTTSQYIKDMSICIDDNLWAAFEDSAVHVF
jgi:ABC-type sugar transport system ATPase subunit